MYLYQISESSYAIQFIQHQTRTLVGLPDYRQLKLWQVSVRIDTDSLLIYQWYWYW